MNFEVIWKTFRKEHKIIAPPLTNYENKNRSTCHSMKLTGNETKGVCLSESTILHLFAFKHMVCEFSIKSEIFVPKVQHVQKKIS